jgi:hypothetical protein
VDPNRQCPQSGWTKPASWIQSNKSGFTRGHYLSAANVRAHRVYGYSPVEQVLMTGNVGLRWQFDYFSEGSIPMP